MKNQNTPKKKFSKKKTVLILVCWSLGWAILGFGFGALLAALI